MAQGKKPRFLIYPGASDAGGAKGHPERGLRVPYVLGRALGEQAQQILYAQRVRAALPTPKTCPTVRPVCGSVGLRLNALKAGIVFFFFPRFCLRQASDWCKTGSKKKKKRKQLVILAAIESHPTQRK